MSNRKPSEKFPVKPSVAYTNDYTVRLMAEARELGWDEDAPTLTIDQIREMPEGTVLWILWSGGNGPYRCTLVFDPVYHQPHIIPLSEPDPINSPLRYYNPLSFVGSGAPFTILWACE